MQCILYNSNSKLEYLFFQWWLVPKVVSDIHHVAEQSVQPHSCSRSNSIMGIHMEISIWRTNCLMVDCFKLSSHDGMAVEYDGSTFNEF